MAQYRADVTAILLAAHDLLLSCVDSPAALLKPSSSVFVIRGRRAD